MYLFKQWLECWDTHGGSLLLLFILFLIGVGMVAFKVDVGKEVLSGAFGALLTALTINRKGANGAGS